MFTKENLDSWNELFPKNKIREQDLANPTEAFLTETLVAYLRCFGYKVEPPFQLNSNDNSREKRLFLVKLVHHIDHILKITEKSYSFLYYDLIRPTPKKTSNMLEILLNHLYYFNMYKTDVFNKTSERIQAREELIRKINQTNDENQQRKIEAGKIKEEIGALSIQVPLAKKELENFNNKNSKQNEELQEMKQTIEETIRKINEMQLQKRNLKKNIVPDNEAFALQTQHNKIQENIAEREELQRSTENSLKKHQDSIKALEEALQSIKEANKIFPLKLLETFKEANKKEKTLNSQAMKMENKKQELLQMIEKQQHELKSLEEKLQANQMRFQQEKLNKLQLIGSKEKLINGNAKCLADLDNEAHVLECEFEQQKEISNYIQGVVPKLFGNTSNKT